MRLVADVRLDNRDEIVAALGLANSDQARLCDSALLLQALRKWGHATLDRLVGEFAFALWDSARRELLLARDFMGLRPLCFHRNPRFFAFASMPSGLHALDGVPYDFDPDFLTERVALLPHVGPTTYFKGIHRVEPGHFVRVTADGAQSSRYWHPRPSPIAAGSGEDFAAGLRETLDRAVAAQLRGAGSLVASQLSGGLDSSTVTASAARLFDPGKVVAFTAVPRPGFVGPTPPGTIADESELAAATARLYPNIEHVIVENDGESPLEWLDRIFAYQQQPQANLANGWWGHAIHREARDRGATVIFKAAGGNATISYAGMQWLPQLLSRGRLLQLARTWAQLSREGVGLASLGARTFGPFVPASVWKFLRGLQGKTTGVLDWSAVNRDSLDVIRRASEERGFDLGERPIRDPVQSRLRGLTRHDGGNAYKGVLAQWGLSTRDPTCDKRVVEYCLNVPVEEFLAGGVPRSLARRAFADRLPPEVSGWRGRGYQSADWFEALDRSRSAIEAEIAAIARCPDAASALDVEQLQHLVRDWPDEWASDGVRKRYRLGLLRGISAGHFVRKVRGTN